MGIQSTPLRPPGDTTTREPLVTEPKAIPVIAKDPQSGPRSITENEEGPTERIGSELFSADPAQSVDAFPEINWSQGNENAHLRA